MDKPITAYQPPPPPPIAEIPLSRPLPTTTDLSLSFQKAVTFGVGLFFLGAFVGIIVMFLVY